MNSQGTDSLLFCTSNIFIIHCLISVNGNMEPLEQFVAGKCRQNAELDSVIYGTSYYDCVEACRNIPTCSSVSMLPLMNLCRINKDEEKEIEICPFYIFSEKKNWISKSPRGCESIICSINQQCEVSDSGVAQCVNYECEYIRWIENGKIFGKDVGKGEKISFVCNPGFVLKGQSSLTCQIDGTWDGDVPTCECASTCSDSAHATFGYSDFESPWSYIEAHMGGDSVQYFDHGLQELPGLVEVLVKVDDGPYEGLIFKATGHADRDDDTPEKHGGVVYIYNDEKVAVTVPTESNTGDSGRAMYMGENSQWTGGDPYESLTVKVKVRCWLPSNMPEPAFRSKSITVESGVNSTEPAYIEIAHYTCSEPAMVNVRLNMTNGRNKGWFSDGQGTNRFVNTGEYGMNGGIIYGFNEKNVRVWVYSGDMSGHNLFNAIDGWGLHNYATTGILDVRVWCRVDNPLYVHDIVQIDQNTPANESEIIFPQDVNAILEDTDLFAYIQVHALEGPNHGYNFNGIDSAMTPMYTTSPSCTYGGLIYAYNKEKIQLRWPSQLYGGSVCIPHMYGRGLNTGRVGNVRVKIKIWRLGAVETTTYDFFTIQHTIVLRLLVIKVRP